MPMLHHDTPIIILPPDTEESNAIALADVLDQHGARQIVTLAHAALQFQNTAPTPATPTPVAKTKIKTRRQIKSPAPNPDACGGITKSGTPCRRGPHCNMHRPPPNPHTASKHTPGIPDNTPDAPHNDADDVPLSNPQAGLPATADTPGCPHCHADPAMMETMRLPGDITEIKCHACGYRTQCP